MKDLPRYPTIRQEAKYGNTTSEYHLREMLSRNELPGFYSGRTFKICHAQLVRKLDEMSAANAVAAECAQQTEKERVSISAKVRCAQ